MKSACAPAYYPVHGRGVHTSQAGAFVRTRHSPPRSTVGDVVTPELTALESALADIFREVSTAARLADMAGLDVIQIDRTGSSADVWHSIVSMAIQDGVLDALVDRARIERPRNKELLAAYEAYKAAQPPAQPKRKRPPQGQDGAHLSDYRNDMRVDALQKEVADLRTVVAELRTTLQYLAIQSAKLEDKLSTVLKVLEAQNETSRKLNEENNHLPHDLQWYGALALVIIIAIIIVAYVGGNVTK